MLDVVVNAMSLSMSMSRWHRAQAGMWKHEACSLNLKLGDTHGAGTRRRGPRRALMPAVSVQYHWGSGHRRLSIRLSRIFARISSSLSRRLSPRLRGHVHPGRSIDIPGVHCHQGMGPPHARMP